MYLLIRGNDVTVDNETNIEMLLTDFPKHGFARFGGREYIVIGPPGWGMNAFGEALRPVDRLRSLRRVLNETFTVRSRLVEDLPALYRRFDDGENNQREEAVIPILPGV